MHRYIFLLIIGLSLGCSKQVPVPTSATLTTEDYQAFSAILREIGKARSCACVVSPVTVPTADYDDMKQVKVKSAHREFLRVLSESTTVTTLTARFDADIKVTLASDKEIEGPDKDPAQNAVGYFWAQFHKKYPNSRWVRLSVPVWNREKTEALVYAANSGGGLDGTGNLYYLTWDKSRRQWKIQKIYPLWIS